MYHFHLHSKPITVSTLAQAVALWVAYRDENRGRRIESDIPVRNYKGELVAVISYDGKLWNADGTVREER